MQHDTPLNLVCDDDFDEIDAESACYTLGYNHGGSFQTYDMTGWSEPEIPFLMDDVECESGSTMFLSCSTSTRSGSENCNHSQNVLLTCFESGQIKLSLNSIIIKAENALSLC